MRQIYKILTKLREDINNVLENDPTARNKLEVILTYPGMHALWLHRLAHWLYTYKLFLLARIIAYCSRFLTSIEIHPAAQIGRRCFIDHGMGVVIGETAKIGDNVIIYQGVTLGSLGKDYTDKDKRHPIIKDHVLLSANSTLLGPITVSEYAKIGAGSVVLHDVAPYTTVVGIPARAVVRQTVNN